MRKTQRILSLILCIVMILSLWPMSIFAEGPYIEQTESALIEDAEILTNEDIDENQEIVDSNQDVNDESALSEDSNEDSALTKDNSENSLLTEDTIEDATLTEDDGKDSTLNKDVSKETSSAEDIVEESKEKPKNSFFQRRAIDGVVITAEAPAGVFPEGARLVCTAVKDENVSDAVDEAVNPLRKKGRRVNASYSFDIKVMYEGVEIEPNLEYGKVNISFDIEKKAGGGAQVDVYHVSGNENENNLQAEKLDSEIEQITPESKTGQKPLPFEEGTSVNIEADGFSFYVVEFTYNNKTYVMEGGTVVPLTDVLNYLEIPNGTISNVEVSDDTLIYAGQLENMVTGEKEWQLISLQPFSTEEWMSVTVDGKIYDITVTDGMTFEHAVLPNSSTEGPELGKDGVTTTYRAEVGKSYEYKRTGPLQAGLTIAKGTSVVIYIPEGSSVTAQGGDASGRDGGGAGILVPEKSKLIIVGKGTLSATGGKPANGGNGQDGADGWAYSGKKNKSTHLIKFAPGKGGDGGYGGGGGGAAIGTNGGTGGKGGDGRRLNRSWAWDHAGWTHYYDDKDRLVFENYEHTYYADGDGAWDGTNGENAAKAGAVYTDGVLTVKLIARAGNSNDNNGKNGKSGESGNGYKDWYDDSWYQHAGGGGSGGGGYGGKRGIQVGTGGGGGGAGGGGGSGGLWCVDHGNYFLTGACGGTTDDGRGEVRPSSFARVTINDGEHCYSGGVGGSLGKSGADAQGYDYVGTYQHDKPQPEVVRTFILCKEDGTYDENSKRVSFNFDGTSYPDLSKEQMPEDDKKTEKYIEGYYTEKDGKGIKVYNHNGKFTGNRLDSLALTAFSSNGEVKLIPHYATAYFSYTKNGLNCYYTRLQDAINEAGGNRIYARCDVALTNTTTISGECTLDLQGHTLSCASGKNLENLFIIGTNGSLLLVGDEGGKIENKGKGNRTAITLHYGKGIKCIAPNYLISAYSEDATGIGLDINEGEYDSSFIQNAEPTSQIVGFGKKLGVGIMVSNITPEGLIYNYSNLFPSTNNAMVNGGSDEGICAALGVRDKGILSISDTSFPNLSSGWNNRVPYTAKSNQMAMLYVGSGGEFRLRENVECHGRTYGIVNDGGNIYFAANSVNNVNGIEVSGDGENKDGVEKTAGFGIYNKSGLISIMGSLTTIKGSGVAAGAIFLGNSENTNCRISRGCFIAPSNSKECIVRDGTKGKVDITGGFYSHDLTGTGLIDETKYLCIDYKWPEEVHDCNYVVADKSIDYVIDKVNGEYNGETHKGYEITNSKFEPIESRTIYEKADGTKLSGPPTDVGRYKVTVTGRFETSEAARQTVEFEITPRPVLISVKPDSCTITYGDKANIQGEMSGLIGDDIGHGSVTLSYRDKVTKEDQPIDAGEYEVYIKEFKVNDKVNGNYQAQLDSAYTFKILPRQLEFDEGQEPTAEEGLVYNGKDQELLSFAGKASVGTIKYALGKADDDKAPADNQYSKDVPKGVDAGAYRVYARVFPPDGAKEENYIKSEIITRDVTIEKATAKFSLTWPEENPTVSITKKTISAQPQCLYDSVTMKGVKLSGTVIYREKDSSEPEVYEFTDETDEDEFELDVAGVYAGTYEISVTAVPNENYKFNDDAESKTITRTITMEKVNVRLEYFKTLTCNDDNPIIYGSKLNENPLTFTAYDNSSLQYGTVSWENGEMVVTEAGSYNFRYVPNEGTASDKTFLATTLNYKIENIAPRPIVIDWANEVFYADDNKHVPTATINNLVDGDECTVKVTVYDKEGHESDAKEVGHYKAIVTEIRGDNNESYTLVGAENIEKQFEVIEFDPAAVVAIDVYAKADGNPHSISFNIGIPDKAEVTYRYHEKVGNTWTDWTESQSTNPGFVNVGNYEVEFTVTYKDRSNKGTGRVHLFEDDIPTFTEYPQFEDKTYTGEMQSFLTNEPQISGSGNYQVMYMINNARGASVSTFSPDPPSKRDAGNYIISYRIADADGNFMTPIFTPPVSVTMNKAEVTYTAPTIIREKYLVKRNYGGIVLINPGSITGGRIEYSYSGERTPYGQGAGYSVDTPYSEIIPEESERGEYTVKYRIVPDRNHYVAAEDAGEKILGKVEIRHLATFAKPKAKQNLEYSGTAQALITPGDEEQLEGGIMKYKLSGEQYASDIPTAIEPGDYSVYYIIDPFEDDYYSSTVINPENQKIDVTISPQTVIKDELTFSKVYDGTTSVNASTECEDKYGNKFTVNVSGVTDLPDVTNENEPAKINNAIITIASETDAAHYYLQVKEAYVNITPKEATLTWKNTVLNYNGKEQKPDAEVSNLIGNDQCSVTVSGGRTNANAIDGTHEEEKAVYTATASALSNPNYKLGTNASTEFVINRVAGVVKTAPKAIEGLKYDTTAHPLVIAGSSDDGTFEYSLNDGALSSNIPEGTDVGTYNVKWKLKGDENHLDSEVSEPITITIDKGIVEVIEKPKAVENIVYDNKNHPLVTQGIVKEGHGKIVFSMTPEDSNSWSETIPEFENAEEYIVWWRVAENEKYSGTEPESITTSIAPKEIELIWENVRKKYNGETLLPTVSASGIYAGDVCSVERRCEKPTINVGDYEIKATLLGADAYNYQPINDTCQFTIEKVPATAIAPQIRNNLTYNGIGQQLIDEGTTSDGEIMYSMDGNQWQNYVLYGNHAGNYSVYWYVKGDSNHTDSPVSVLKDKAVIAQKEAVLEWEEKEIFYSGSFSCPKANVTNLVEGDTCNVSVEGAAVNAGEHMAYASYLDNPDYKLPSEPSERTHIYEIKKVAPAVYLPSGVENLVYTGSSLVLITPGMVTGGTMWYKCGENGEWTTDFTAITGENVGDYDVYIRVEGDGNHTNYPLSVNPEDDPGEDPEDPIEIVEIDGKLAVYFKVTIAAVPSYLESVPIAVDGLVYRKGVPQALVSGGQSSTGIIEYSFDGNEWSQDIPQRENAGNYTVYCRAGANGNYRASEAVIISNTISKAVPSTATVKASDIVYGDSLERSIISGMAEGDSVVWKSPSFVPGSIGKIAANAVYKPADPNNYMETELTLSLNVTPKTIEITWPQADEFGNISLTYNGKEQLPQAVAEGLVGVDACELTVEGAGSVLPGTYTAKVTKLSDSNYALPEETTRTYTIVNAVMTDVIVNDVNEKYDGKWHSVEVVNAPEGSVCEFSTDGISYSTISPEFREICDAQPVWYKISCAGYETLKGTAYVTISNNPIITRKPSPTIGMLYNGREKSLCSVARVSEGTVVEYSLDKENWSSSVPKAKDAGQYQVYYKAERTIGDVTDYCSGSLIAVISKRAVAVNWTDTEFDYDGSRKCPVPELSGILEGDGEVSPTVSGAAVNAGTYTAQIVSLSNPNYIVRQNASTSFTIKKVRAEFTAPEALEGVIEDGQKKQIIIPGSTPHGTILYTSELSAGNWSEEVPTAVNAGNYTVLYCIRCDGNHYDNSLYSVDAKVYYGQAGAGTAPKAYNPVYNGQGQALCSPAVSTDGTALYSLDNENWSESVPEGTNAGDYTIYWKIKGDELHLDSLVQSLEAKIEKASSYVTKYPEVISGLVYNGTRRALVRAGEARGGQIVYACYYLGSGDSYEVPTGVSAGEYIITWYIEGDDNHKDSERSLLKTSIAKASWPTQGISATSITYGDTLASSRFVNVSGGKVVWKSPNLMPDSAGTKEVIAIFTPDDTTNYLTEDIGISVTVNKRRAELQWDKETFEYDGRLKIPSASVMNTVGDDVCIVMVEGSGTELGTYTATATQLGNSNYELGTTGTSFNYSIVPGYMNVHAEDVLVQYNSEDTNSYRITVAGAPEGASIYYSTDGQNYYTENPSYKGKAGQDVEALVYYKVVHPNYNTASGTARVLIYGGTIASVKEEPMAIANQYSGESKALITAGEVTDANTMQLQYALKDENGIIGDFSTAIPTATNAGTYTVCYQIVSKQTSEVPVDERVIDSPVYELNATIAPKNIDVTWQRSAGDTGSELIYAYDGKTHLPYAYGSATGITLVAEVNGSLGTNPGVYQAEATGFIGNNNYAPSAETKKVNFEISRLPVDDLIEPKPVEGLIYNGFAQPLAIPGSTLKGTILYGLTENKNDFTSAIPEMTDAGTYRLYYYVHGDAFHQDSEIRHIVCVINSAQSYIVTVPEAKKGLVYNGKAQRLASEGSAFGGTVVYSLTDNAEDFTTVVPTAETAGKYTVYYKIKGDKNYTDSAVRSVSAQIDIAECDVVEPEAIADLEYSGSPIQLIIPGASTGGRMRYSLNGGAWTSDATQIVATKAGSYRVEYYAQSTVTAGAGIYGRYKNSPIKSITITIGKAEPEYTGNITATDIIYGQSLGESSIESEEGIVFWADEGIVPEHAGIQTYNAWFVPKNLENIKPVLVEVNVKVLPKTVGIEWGEENIQYSGKEIVRKAKATGILDGDECELTIKGANVDPGSYMAQITGLSNPDYRLPDINLERPFNITGDALMEGVYALDVYSKFDGNGHSIEVKGVLAGAQIYYSMDGEEFTEENPERVEAGVSTVTYKVQCKGYEDFIGSAKITVYPADTQDFVFTEKPAAEKITYNAAQQQLVTPGSAVCKDKDGTEHDAVILYAVIKDTQSVEVSFASDVPYAVDAGNYTVVYVAYDPLTGIYSDTESIDSVVAPKELELKWDGLKWSYDGNAHIPTVTAANLCIGDACEITVTGSAHDVGTHVATATAVSNANYCLPAECTKNYKIEKAEPTCILPEGMVGLTYNGNNQVLVKPGLATSGSFEYSIDGSEYSSSVPKRANAGTYTINYRIAESRCYCEKTGSISVTIAKAPGKIDIKPKAIENIYYDGEEHSLVRAGISSCGEMQYSIDGENYTSSIPEGVDAGEYIVYYYSAESSNYSATEPESIDVYIDYIPQGTPPKSVSTVYNGSAQALAVPGNPSTDKYYYSLSNADNWSEEVPQETNTGNYEVFYKLGESGEVRSLVSSIEKAEAIVMLMPQTKDLKYTGSDIELLSEPGKANTSMEYSIGGITWSSNIPKAQATGTYKVLFRAAGDDNHWASDVQILEVTIAKAEPIVPNLTATIGYGDALRTTQINGAVDGKAIWADPNEVPDSAGDKTAKAYFIPTDSNYEKVLTDVKVEVIPRQAEITWGETILDYTGEEIGPEAWVSNLLPGDTCTVTVSGKATKNGSYTATADSLDNPSYCLADPKPTVEFSIVNQTMTDIVARNVFGRYDGTTGYSINVEGVPEGGIVYYSINGTVYTTENPVFIDAGNHTVHFKVKAPGYKEYKGYASVFIINKTEEIPEIHMTDPVPIIRIYNGTYQSVANPGSAYYETTDETHVKMNMMYLLTTDPSNTDRMNEMTTSMPLARNAGTYYLLYMAIDSVHGYASEVQTKEITIYPSEIVLKWDKLREYPFDGEEHVPSALALGLRGDDEVSVNVTGADWRIGEHTAIAEISETNYVLSKNPTAKYVINKGYTDPTAKKKLVYNGDSQELIEGGKALAGNMQYCLDDGQWQYEIPSATNAGTYIVRFRTDIEGSPVGSVEVRIAKATAGRVFETAWEKGSAKVAKFTCSTPYSSDAVLLIDDKEVNKEFYTLRSGSTIAEVKGDFMDSLSNGVHEVAFSYDNYEKAIGKVYVYTKSVRTGDLNNINVYMILIGYSACAIMATSMYIARSKKKRRKH